MPLAPPRRAPALALAALAALAALPLALPRHASADPPATARAPRPEGPVEAVRTARGVVYRSRHVETIVGERQRPQQFALTARARQVYSPRAEPPPPAAPEVVAAVRAAPF